MTVEEGIKICDLGRHRRAAAIVAANSVARRAASGTGDRRRGPSPTRSVAHRGIALEQVEQGAQRLAARRCRAPGRASRMSRASSRATASRSAWAARSARRNSGRPLCRVPSSSPAPRSRRSSSAMRKPSSLSRMIVEPRLRRLAERRRVEQQAGRRLVAAADAAAQLVQLGEAEALGMLDDHDGRLRHVDADLDHRGGDQEVDAAAGESRHDAVLLGALHLAMDQADARRRRALPARRGARSAAARSTELGFLDQRADPIDLGRRARSRGRRRRPPRRAARAAGCASRSACGPAGFSVQARDVEIAIGGQHQRARDRRRRHHQDVDARCPWRRARMRCSTPKRCCSSMTASARSLEVDIVLEQRMRADDDVDLARGEAAQQRVARACPSRGRSAARCATPAASRERREGRVMLAREDFGRRHEGGLARRPRPHRASPAARPRSCRCRHRLAAAAACGSARPCRRRSSPACSSRTGRSRASSFTGAPLRPGHGRASSWRRPRYDRALLHLRKHGMEVEQVPMVADDGMDVAALTALREGESHGWSTRSPTSRTPAAPRFRREARRLPSCAGRAILVFEDDRREAALRGRADPPAFELSSEDFHHLPPRPSRRRSRRGSAPATLLLPGGARAGDRGARPRQCRARRRSSSRPSPLRVPDEAAASSRTSKLVRDGLPPSGATRCSRCSGARCPRARAGISPRAATSSGSTYRAGSSRTRSSCARARKTSFFIKGADFFFHGGGEEAARLAFSFATAHEIDEDITRPGSRSGRGRRLTNFLPVARLDRTLRATGAFDIVTLPVRLPLRDPVLRGQRLPGARARAGG